MGAGCHEREQDVEEKPLPKEEPWEDKVVCAATADTLCRERETPAATGRET